MIKLTVFTMASALSLACGAPALAQAIPPASIAGSPAEGEWVKLSEKEAELRRDVNRLHTDHARDMSKLAEIAATKDRALSRSADARQSYERLLASPPPTGHAEMADRWAKKLAESADDWALHERKHEDGAKKWRKAEERESKSASALRKAQDRLDKAVRERTALEQRALMARR
ncbi:hypothetical protein [Sphingomicrobium lutaoense]|uniref:Chromosome segregation ATPase n=1 Tax=Sphingomicrobium lutaoense TaxID=515949 RepID=A0A839Z450_9SPHN|nr:hypothetical protein [Sphingomicrobium lutaoense]MBB3764382.1 chromosome segregation ATPase [Sphingomicrobium lutaoense]